MTNNAPYSCLKNASASVNGRLESKNVAVIALVHTVDENTGTSGDERLARTETKGYLPEHIDREEKFGRTA